MGNVLDDLASIARDHEMHGGRWVRDSYNPTVFDDIARGMEAEYGIDAVWNKVRSELLATDDEYVRRQLIESYGNSNVRDGLKRKLLEDLALDSSVGMSSKKTAMVELGEYVEDDKWQDFLKAMYRRVDAEMRQVLFHTLVIPDFDASGIRDRVADDGIDINLKKLVWLFCDMVTVWSCGKLLDIVTRDYVPKYGKAKVAETLRFVSDHEYCTTRTRDCVRHTLSGIGY